MAYNKHYLEKVRGWLVGGPVRGVQELPQQRPRRPRRPPPHPASWRLGRGNSLATSPAWPPQAYSEVGSDPRAFLAAALDFLQAETGFLGQPGAADTVAHLVQQRLPSGGGSAATAKAAKPPAAVAPAAVPAAAAPAAAASAAVPAAAAPAAAAPAAAAPADTAPQQGVQPEAEGEQAGSSGLSESPRCPVSCLQPFCAAPPATLTPHPIPPAIRRAQRRQRRRPALPLLDADAARGGGGGAAAGRHQGPRLRGDHRPRQAARGAQGPAACAG